MFSHTIRCISIVLYAWADYVKVWAQTGESPPPPSRTTTLLFVFVLVPTYCLFLVFCVTLWSFCVSVVVLNVFWTFSFFLWSFCVFNLTNVTFKHIASDFIQMPGRSVRNPSMSVRFHWQMNHLCYPHSPHHLCCWQQSLTDGIFSQCMSRPMSPPPTQRPIIRERRRA